MFDSDSTTLYRAFTRQIRKFLVVITSLGNPSIGGACGSITRRFVRMYACVMWFVYSARFDIEYGKSWFCSPCRKIRSQRTYTFLFGKNSFPK